jgi:hypothetical protein
MRTVDVVYLWPREPAADAERFALIGGLTATVPDAAPEIATPNHAVVLVFTSQTVKVGDAVPTETGSSARGIR